MQAHPRDFLTLHIMKKIKLVLPFCAVLLLVGCEKKLFHFIATITQSPAFAVDQTGAFQQIILVVSSAIQNAVDIPAGGDITRVDIESLAIRTLAKSGNQAAAMQVTGVMIEAGGVQQIIFGSETISIGSVDSLVSLKTLNETGINRLRSKLEGYIKNTDNQPFTIQLTGNTVPSGQRLSADLQLVLKTTVKYDQCLEVPGFFSEAEKCGE
jgi:hypothetical protein